MVINSYKCFCPNPDLFDTELDKAKNSELEEKRKQAEAEQRDGKKHNFTRMFERKIRLWNPVGRKLVVSGIICSDGSVARAPNEQNEELKGAWQGAFVAKDVDMQLATDTLNSWCSPWDFSEVDLPDDDDVDLYLAHTSNSAPGKDGLPYRAWRNRFGIQLIVRLTYFLAGGGLVPEEENDSLMLFILRTGSQ